MSITRLLRRPTAALAAAALALPLSVAAVAPAAAAVSSGSSGSSRSSGSSPVGLVDRGWPAYPTNPYGYGGYGMPYGYTDPYGSTTTTIDSSPATASESTGLVDITSVVDFGSGEAAGTGMVIGSNGIVVTNHHVVEGATTIKVTVVSTGRTYRARVIGYDAAKDVAVLKLVGASDLRTVTTDTGAITAGEDVTAVGNAGGTGTLSAASGTVTRLRTPITVSDDQTGRAKRLRNLIEIDADIVPGDSGGALLDSTGAVIGMNVAASSGSSNISGYVIPVKRVLRIADAILAGDDAGTVSIGYDAFLGVSLAGSGTLLDGVLSGGAAQQAGLAAGDTVTAVDGVRVSTAAGLKQAISTHDPRDSVSVTWTDSSGASHTARVTLGRAPLA